jgi:hypothetical protein
MKNPKPWSSGTKLNGRGGIFDKNGAPIKCTDEETRQEIVRAVNGVDNARLEELENFIQDARAFIEWACENGRMDIIGSTLSHDIARLARRYACFSPRVSGYAKRGTNGGCAR